MAARLPAREEAAVSKRKQIVDYDDWLCTDPDAEGDDEADTDDAQEPDDTPELEPEYTYWRDVC